MVSEVHFKRYCAKCGKLFQKVSKWNKICPDCNKSRNKWQTINPGGRKQYEKP